MKPFYLVPVIFLAGCASTDQRSASIALMNAGAALQGNPAPRSAEPDLPPPDLIRPEVRCRSVAIMGGSVQTICR
jgi:hypothetical protein